MDHFKARLLDLKQKYPELKTHIQAVLLLIEEYEPEEEEIIYIKASKGFVSKKEIVEKVFNQSRYSFLHAVKMVKDHYKAFNAEYLPYTKAQTMPVYLFKQIMRHLDIPFVLI